MAKLVIDEPNMVALKIRDEKYEGVHFQCGTFDESEFTTCLFFDVEFEGVWANEAIFKRCEFNQTLFYDIQAYAAKFDGSRFSRVDFRGGIWQRRIFRIAFLSIRVLVPITSGP